MEDQNKIPSIDPVANKAFEERNKFISEVMDMFKGKTAEEAKDIIDAMRWLVDKRSILQ